MNRLRDCVVLSIVLIAGGFSPSVWAQAEPDLLEQAKQRMALEAQRLEQLVIEADRNATKVGLTNPAGAIDILKGALASLETATALEESKLLPLKRKLELGIRAYEGRLTDQKRPPIAPIVNDVRRQQLDRQQQDAVEIARMMQQIRELRASGKPYEANRLQDELNRKAPANPAVTAWNSFAGRNELLADGRRIREQKEGGWVGVQRELDKSSIPEVNDYVLPSDWVEKSKRRSPALQLTKVERAILEALNKPVSVDFEGQTFDEVIRYLEKSMGQPIIVPKAAMDEAQITSETPVRLKTERVSMRTVLKKILGEVGLTYIIKDQTIQVTTQRGARETLTTRTYYVGDIVAVVDLRWGPVVNQFQMIENVNRLMTMVSQSVDPLSWDINGGAGRIWFDPVTMSIVVRQTAEVHMMMGVGLR
jgi:hypothetical protein